MTASGGQPKGHTLAVRLDALGDMIICGPALRALAAGSKRLTVLAGPQGAAAAALLPGVDDVVVFDCPWIVVDAAPVEGTAIDELVERVRALRIDRAVVLTSFHQSALPTALVLRLAGVAFVAAVSEDYPGSLLDVRIAPPGDAPEPVRMLRITAAAGFPAPPGDPGNLAIDRSRLVSNADLPAQPYVVVHPGASVPARTYPVQGWSEVVTALAHRGRHVVLTGGRSEAALTRQLVADPAQVTDLAGRLDLHGLARVLDGADALLVGNTGPAHLAAALDTPVVSLFSPVVPAVRWAPYGRAVAVLGDQQAACRDTRARSCPVPGHPCLSSVTADEVLAALDRVCAQPLLGVPA